MLTVDELEPRPEPPEEPSLFSGNYEEKLNAWNFRRLLAGQYDVVVTNPPYMAVSNTHITDEMWTSAALKIDRGIGKAADTGMGEATRQEAVPKRAPFQPYKGKRRKPGTGCISQINDHLWEGRFSPVWPDGVKRPRNIYAHDRETCEQRLAELIAQTKAEIAAEKARRAGERHPA